MPDVEIAISANGLNDIGWHAAVPFPEIPRKDRIAPALREGLGDY
jgi:hypothetical protein